jgi:hypothetical protein
VPQLRHVVRKVRLTLSRILTEPHAGGDRLLSAGTPAFPLQSDEMERFRDALLVLSSMKGEGVIEDYAVAGAMAMLFWAEPVPTYDLDVLVLLPEAPAPIVSLDPIYRWTESRGYAASEEHIVIEGVPTQFLPSPSRLADEAILSAATLDYDGVPVRVVRPECLIALYLEPSARTPRRRERVEMLLELPELNRPLLDEILARHGIHL